MTILTSGDIERLGVSAACCIIDCDCDGVDGAALQVLYSVAGVSEIATVALSPSTGLPPPHHL